MHMHTHVHHQGLQPYVVTATVSTLQQPYLPRRAITDGCHIFTDPIHSSTVATALQA